MEVWISKIFPNSLGRNMGHSRIDGPSAGRDVCLIAPPDDFKILEFQKMSVSKPWNPRKDSRIFNHPFIWMKQIIKNEQLSSIHCHPFEFD